MHKPSVLTFVAVTSLAAGCAPLYLPPAAHVPLLGREGQLSVSGHAGFNGYDLQAAYAVPELEGLGVIAGGSYEPWSPGPNAPDDGKPDDKIEHEHLYGEGGLGYYVPFGIGRFETYLGAGYGTSRGGAEVGFSNGTTVEQSLGGRYARGFAQANIGLSTDIVDAGLTLRYAYIHYTATKTPSGYSGKMTADTGFIEPALFLRLGYKAVKASLQGGFAWPAENTDDGYIMWNPFHLSLGVYVELAQLLGLEG